MKNLLATSRHVSVKIPNVAKIHYQKHKSENTAMKAKLCYEKLQDSSKFLEQLAVVNKCSHFSNKIDFEKGKLNKRRLQNKISSITLAFRAEKIYNSATKDNFRNFTIM